MSYAAMSAAEMLKQSPLYAHYAQVAPRPEDWPVLIGKTSELLKVDDDWRDEVAALEAQTMLVFADADSVRPAHIVEFFGLPGTTHYDVLQSPLLVPAVTGFLA
jgi:hypothetical protein